MLKNFKMLRIICVLTVICLVSVPVPAFAGAQGPDADGTIMYSQDFEQNMDGISESPQSLPDSRVTRVSDPFGQRGTVLKLLWQSGDNYRTSSGTNPRTEINAYGYEWPRNEVVSIAWGQRFDTSVLNASIAQVLGDNGPYWMLNADETGKLSVMGVSGGSDFDYTLKTNQWNDFKVEWKGTTSNAYFKMWINGDLVLNKTGLSFPRETDDMHAKFGIYNRDEGVEENNTRNCYLSNISIGKDPGSGGSGGNFDGFYRIMARHSDKAVVVESASTANEANIFQYSYGGSNTNDEWEITPIGGGKYTIMARHSGKAMVVESASTSSGANVFQYNYGGSQTNDEWKIEDVGSGYYRIVNDHSGLVLDVQGNSTSNSANIQQYNWNGGNNQQWEIIPVP